MTRVAVSIEFEADDSKALIIADRLFNQFYNQKGFFGGLYNARIPSADGHEQGIEGPCALLNLYDLSRLYDGCRKALGECARRIQALSRKISTIYDTEPSRSNHRVFPQKSRGSIPEIRCNYFEEDIHTSR